MMRAWGDSSVTAFKYAADMSRVTASSCAQRSFPSSLKKALKVSAFLPGLVTVTTLFARDVFTLPA
jgi:hypothetical protein